MADQAVVTFTYDEYIRIKRIVLDRDVQGALDFMKIIVKRCEQITTIETPSFHRHRRSVCPASGLAITICQS